MQKTQIFWVLERNGMFITPTNSDWGPSHLPYDNPFAAMKFETPGEARRWADSPGHGWRDFEPVRFRLTMTIERLP